MGLTRAKTFDNGLTREQVIADFRSVCPRPLYVLDEPMKGVDGVVGELKSIQEQKMRTICQEDFSAFDTGAVDYIVQMVWDSFENHTKKNTSYHCHVSLDNVTTGLKKEISLVVMPTDDDLSFLNFYGVQHIEKIMAGRETFANLDESDKKKIEFSRTMSVSDYNCFLLAHELAHAVDPLFRVALDEYRADPETDVIVGSHALNKAEFFADILAVMYMQKHGVDVALAVSQARAMQLPVFKYSGFYNENLYPYINHHIYGVLRKEKPDIENMDMMDLIDCAVDLTDKYAPSMQRLVDINKQFSRQRNEKKPSPSALRNVSDVQHVLRPFVKNMPHNMPKNMPRP